MVHFDQHLQQITSYNRSLKWLFLHSRPSQKTTRPLKNRPLTDDQLFQWLLDVSRCEILLLNLYTATLENREDEGSKRQQKIRTLLNQLADFFEHGFVKMSDTQKTNFVKWVRNLSETVEKIDLKMTDESIETVQQIIRRVKQVRNMRRKGSMKTILLLKITDSSISDAIPQSEIIFLEFLNSRLAISSVSPST